jgi:hypothetical protein
VRSSLRIPQLPVWLTRVIAAGGIAVVLFLATLAASPELHARFHGAAVSANDEGCAIGLFASGVSLATDAVAVPAPSVQWADVPAAAPEKIFLVASRYLRQPERGPPVS